jgi:hypothetical protein
LKDLFSKAIKKLDLCLQTKGEHIEQTPKNQRLYSFQKLGTLKRRKKMKKYLWLMLILLVASLALTACDTPPYTAPEGTPHKECVPVCKEIYDQYCPDVSTGACVSQCQTGKYTAFKLTCNEDVFLEFFGFETKKDCQNFWDSLK